MAGNDAFMWFIATTLTFFAMLFFGTLFAVRAYEERRRRAAVHFHVPHPSLHRPERRHRG